LFYPGFALELPIVLGAGGRLPLGVEIPKPASGSRITLAFDWRPLQWTASVFIHVKIKLLPLFR